MRAAQLGAGPDRVPRCARERGGSAPKSLHGPEVIDVKDSRPYTAAEREALPLPTEPLGFTATTEGRVLWWRGEKGTGAIETEATAPRGVWCHFSAIEMEGFKELHEGQRVEVEYERADQDTFKFRAIRVRPL